MTTPGLLAELCPSLTFRAESTIGVSRDDTFLAELALERQAFWEQAFWEGQETKNEGRCSTHAALPSSAALPVLRSSSSSGPLARRLHAGPAGKVGQPLPQPVHGPVA